MKKLLFILALLAMVVLPNVAPAHEPSESRQLSDGVDLVALEGRAGGGGEGMGVAELPAEQVATLASGDLRCGQQMRFRNGPCLPLDALLVFRKPLAKIGSMEFALSPLQGEFVTLSE